ncbi:hypothetical protein AAMO2058_000873200 [Amorphochlora amoebiformis]
MCPFSIYIPFIRKPHYFTIQKNNSTATPSYLLIWRSQHHHGLFSNFTLALTFVRRHYVPGRTAIAIDWSGLETYPCNGQNLWRKLFLQPYEVNCERVSQARRIENTEFPGDFSNLSGVADHGGELNRVVLVEGRKLVRQHIRVQPAIIQKACKFVSHRMTKYRKILAVHVRRTDKISESKLNFLFRFQELHGIILTHMQLYSYDGFFLCSDDQKLKDYISTRSGDLCITYDAVLSRNKCVPPHFDKNIDGYRKAEDVLVEVLVMASCAGFLSTLSNVANAVMFFGNSELVKNHTYFHVAAYQHIDDYQGFPLAHAPTILEDSTVKKDSTGKNGSTAKKSSTVKKGPTIKKLGKKIA